MGLQLDDYRLLGRSWLRVSPLSLRYMPFGMQSWETNMDEANRRFNFYVERGGNFIDTADFYAQGEPERILGRLIPVRRQRQSAQEHDAGGGKQPEALEDGLH